MGSEMCIRDSSWASAARKIGVPISVISEGMGHENESTTRIYLASLDTSAIDNANMMILKSIGERSCTQSCNAR